MLQISLSIVTQSVYVADAACLVTDCWPPSHHSELSQISEIRTGITIKHIYKILQVFKCTFVQYDNALYPHANLTSSQYAFYTIL